VFADILVVGGEAGVTLGAPLVAGASVAAEVIEQKRDDKVIAFKKRRRQNSKRRRGHRQSLTVVRIAEILTDGAKPAKAAAAARSRGPAPAESTAAAPAEAPVRAAAPKPAKAAAAAASADDSNLSLISGIGPTIEKKLRSAGVQSWSEIASWSEADVARYDAELSLQGRPTRDEWIQQAKDLIAGKPPRAKIDKAEKASGKDR